MEWVSHSYTNVAWLGILSSDFCLVGDLTVGRSRTVLPFICSVCYLFDPCMPLNDTKRMPYKVGVFHFVDLPSQ